MSKVFNFGERIDGYEVSVLNEREVRAGAGILFFFALISFMNAWLTGNFQPTRIFVVAFLIDFTIRVLINPKYAPSLVLGRLAVRNQVPEYVGATQKRFAWSIGLALATAMLFLVVINRVIGPINLVICSACLVLLFFESAFGICIACKIYNFFHQEKAQLCPGNTCEVFVRHESQKIGAVQMVVVVLFFAAITVVAKSIPHERSPIAIAETSPTEKSPVVSEQDKATGVAGMPLETASSGDCTPPDWAVKMGHADMWKLHHNCK
jgi:hypothetical protein